MTPVEWSVVHNDVIDGNVTTLQEGVHNASNVYVNFLVQQFYGWAWSRQQVDSIILKGLYDKRWAGYK